MPFFKTTHNIFIDKGEYFNPNWMDSNKIILPPRTEWDYKRLMQIEDVDLWEVIYEAGYSIYASWSPYAEFYMVLPTIVDDTNKIELYYGPGANSMVKKRMKELGMIVPNNQHWIDPEDMWLYPEVSK